MRAHNERRPRRERSSVEPSRRHFPGGLPGSNDVNGSGTKNREE
jgi:hypothetical protein